jgi:transposase
METERIALSQRERDRLKVLHEAKEKHWTQVAGAQRLKVTDRYIRRWLLRVREQGDRAVIHGLRGRPSHRKLAAPFEQKILARLRQRYADFGPTLAAEHLVKDGWRVSRDTLRRLVRMPPQASCHQLQLEPSRHFSSRTQSEESARICSVRLT